VRLNEEDRHADDDHRRVRAFNGSTCWGERQGLFAAEGLDLTIAVPPPADVRSNAEAHWSGRLQPGRLQSRGEAAMFMGESAAITAGWRKAGSVRCRSGRRGMIVCGPSSWPELDVFTHRSSRKAGRWTRQRHRLRGAPDARGRDAAPGRDHAAATADPADRSGRDARRSRGNRAAGALVTVAERAGCRVVSSTFFHGTWVADASVSAEAYAAFVGPHARGPAHQRR